MPTRRLRLEAICSKYRNDRNSWLIITARYTHPYALKNHLCQSSWTPYYHAAATASDADANGPGPATAAAAANGPEQSLAGPVPMRESPHEGAVAFGNRASSGRDPPQNDTQDVRDALHLAVH